MVDSILQETVNGIYDYFLNLVSESRDLPVDRVHELAQGRVWMAGKAQDLGLVDNLGSLDDAISAAAKLAGISEWSVKRVERERAFWEELVSTLDIDVSGPAPLPGESLLRQLPSSLFSSLQFLDRLDDPRQIYSLCLGCQLEPSETPLH